jgi:protein unc-45
MCDVEDLPTRRAASGALAILSMSETACRALAQEGRGVQVILGLLEEEEDEGVVHRCVEVVKNMARVGPALVGKLVSAGGKGLLQKLVKRPNPAISEGAKEGLEYMK